MPTPSHFRLGSISSISREYIIPENALKGCVYECPECQNTVIFKRGKIKRSHFAHKASTNICTYYSRPSESQLHKDAKLRLKCLIDKKEEIFIYKRCKKCMEYDTIILPYQEGYFPKLEHSFWMNNNRKQADLAYINNSGEILFILEVLNTHHTAEGNRPEPYYELSAVDIINSQFGQFDCYRNWTVVCKNCSEIRQKEEERRILRLEELLIQKEKDEERRILREKQLLEERRIQEEKQRIQDEKEEENRILHEKQRLEERRIQKEKHRLVEKEKRSVAKKRKDIKNQQALIVKYEKIQNINDTIYSLNQSKSDAIDVFESERGLYITKIKKYYPSLSENISFLILKQILRLCLEKNKLES